MNLLDKPMSQVEKENMLRMLDGCISRICVSNDAEEIVRMIGFANNYVSMLGYNRMKQLQETKKEVL